MAIDARTAVAHVRRQAMTNLTCRACVLRIPPAFVSKLVRFDFQFAGVMAGIVSIDQGLRFSSHQRIRMPPSQAAEHHKRVTTSVNDDDIDPQVDQQVREWFCHSAVTCVTSKPVLSIL